MVKAMQKYLNDSMEVVSVADGAYRPLKVTLSTVIAHEVQSITGCVCVYVLASFPGQSRLQSLITCSMQIRVEGPGDLVTCGDVK